LGRFLFSGDEVFKSVSALSGGELSRLALAVLTMKGANFLLLDEPTTHLDVESQEVLQGVLQNFEGTILLVSHDRYLADALATHVWIIQEGRLRKHEGNYSSYLAELQQERAPQRKGEERPAPRARDEQRRLERQAERAARRQVECTEGLEAEIHRLEQELATVTGLIDLASANHDVARLQTLT
jgi:ATP-binding cassette subfamily F protein 3